MRQELQTSQKPGALAAVATACALKEELLRANGRYQLKRETARKALKESERYAEKSSSRQNANAKKYESAHAERMTVTDRPLGNKPVDT